LQAFPISFAVFRTDFGLSKGPTSGEISMIGISLKDELFEIIVLNSSVQSSWLILIIAAECKDKCGETKNPATAGLHCYLSNYSIEIIQIESYLLHIENRLFRDYVFCTGALIANSLIKINFLSFF